MQSLASNHGDLYQFPLIFGGRSFSALVHQLSVLCSQAPRRSSVFRTEQVSTSACLPLVGCSPSLSTAPSWSGRWSSLPCAASSLPVRFHLCVDFCWESSWAPGAELSSAKRSSTGGADLCSPKCLGLQCSPLAALFLRFSLFFVFLRRRVDLQEARALRPAAKLFLSVGSLEFGR